MCNGWVIAVTFTCCVGGCGTLTEAVTGAIGMSIRYVSSPVLSMLLRVATGAGREVITDILG